MKISINKQYCTRDGREVRIYAVDGRNDFPIHGAINKKGAWQSHSWNEYGRFIDEDEEHDYDLIEVKPRIQREMWLNVYEEDWKYCIAAGYSTKAAADLVAPPSRIACVKVVIDCEEGEGL